MLKSMDDVLSFFERFEERPKEFPFTLLKSRRERVSLAEDLAEFCLPRDYIDFVEKYEVEGAEIGYFHFAANRFEDIHTYLSNNNGENGNPMVPDYMTEVGSHEADIILVKKGCHKHSDSSVYCLNHAHGDSAVPEKIAHNYEQFVLLMSNYYKLSLENREGDDYARVLREKFTELLQSMEPRIDDQMIDAWIGTCNLRPIR